jgi:predicted O-methyltransferase YrrM
MRSMISRQLPIAAPVFAALLAVAQPSAAQSPPDKPLARPADITKDYRFTADRFKGRIPYWTSGLADLKDRPVRYLEIGVFEGRSLFWMLDNILTHPDSEVVAMDTFGWSYYRHYLHNLEVSGAADRVTTIKGYAEEKMMELPRDSFDLIFIDDGHHARSVYMQTGIAWLLLKKGGILIFDDYYFKAEEWPLDNRPEVAINAFLTAFGEDLEIVRTGREVWIRKLGQLPNCYHCSRFFDAWMYDWDQSKLLTVEDQEEIELTDAERELVESIYLERRYPELGMALSEGVVSNPTFKKLQERLGIKLEGYWPKQEPPR